MEKHFIVKLAYTILHMLKMVYLRDGFCNPYKKLQQKRERPAYILANGPSLSEFLKEIEQNFTPYEQADFFVVNEFVHSELYTVIRPGYYVVSDPMFYQDTLFSERGHRVMEALAAKTTWPMTLFIPRASKRYGYLTPVLQNPCINIVYINKLDYLIGFSSVRKFLYRHGLSNDFYSVVLVTMYAALLLGYKKLYVYGIDHNFFSNTVIDDNNVLCVEYKHFYNNETELRPFLQHYTNPPRPFTMTEYLYRNWRIFKGHEAMQEFAQSIGAEIINCTPNSMVDVYPRKKA